MESTPQRPRPIRFDPSGVPQALRRGRRFVNWRYEWYNGCWIEVPVQPDTFRRADTRDPTAWGWWRQAVNHYEAHPDQLDGVAIVPTDTDGLVGIRLGQCIESFMDEDDGLRPSAADIVNKVRTYWERTPDGAGVQGFAFGALRPGRWSRDLIHMWQGGSFLALTGFPWYDSPPTIEDQHQELVEVQARAFTTGALDIDLEALPVGAALVELLSEQGAWAGTATDLLKELKAWAPSDVTSRRMWPRNAQRLSIALKQIAPALQRRGWHVKDGKSNGAPIVRLTPWG